MHIKPEIPIVDVHVFDKAGAGAAFVVLGASAFKFAMEAGHEDVDIVALGYHVARRLDFALDRWMGMLVRTEEGVERQTALHSFMALA